MKLKKLAITTALISSGLLLSPVSFAKIYQCLAEYQDKPFIQATIWGSLDGIGPIECDYKSATDPEIIKYEFPKSNNYRAVHGKWQSTMPGTRWCSVDNGNTADTCTFQQIYSLYIKK